MESTAVLSYMISLACTEWISEKILSFYIFRFIVYVHFLKTRWSTESEMTYFLSVWSDFWCWLQLFHERTRLMKRWTERDHFDVTNCWLIKTCSSSLITCRLTVLVSNICSGLWQHYAWKMSKQWSLFHRMASQ